MNAETLAAIAGIVVAFFAGIVAVGNVYIKYLETQIDKRVVALEASVVELNAQRVEDAEARRVSDTAKDATIAELRGLVAALEARVAGLHAQLTAEIEARRVSDATKDATIADLQAQLREAAATIQGLVKQVEELQKALVAKTAQVEEKNEEQTNG